ncbi:hypothetical protein RM572_21890 [Streptomyces sp. DSM 42041]|uniref:Uncharacterized protein n=1 Tax=Streptomyces hazeniae TaxID=3075538 RepID=A0ABU2NWQ1_9ACTN|nr:hypothetical protein [Streptomyces sp. DSM 42041]MDT0381414.1 hypothetical protein [Streptomyces sp. DSM 42041]
MDKQTATENAARAVLENSRPDCLTDPDHHPGAVVRALLLGVRRADIEAEVKRQRAS